MLKLERELVDALCKLVEGIQQEFYDRQLAGLDITVSPWHEFQLLLSVQSTADTNWQEIVAENSDYYTPDWDFAYFNDSDSRGYESQLESVLAQLLVDYESIIADDAFFAVFGKALKSERVLKALSGLNRHSEFVVRLSDCDDEHYERFSL